MTGREDKAAPKLERLLYVLTGAIQTALGPTRLRWLQEELPGTEIAVALTEMGKRFATPASMEALGNCRVVVDSWDVVNTDLHHVDLSQWADGIVVHPASANYIAELAGGHAGRPVLLALQVTAAPVVVCPALPPGSLDNPIIAENLQRLGTRPNVRVLPPTPGVSLRTGRMDAHAPAGLDTALQTLHELRTELAEDTE